MPSGISRFAPDPESSDDADGSNEEKINIRLYRNGLCDLCDLAWRLGRGKGGRRTAVDHGSDASLICTWSAYSTYDESIVIDLSDRAAYWVNQNRPLIIHQLNAGRVVPRDVRDGVRVSKKRVEKEVAVRMIIDRISGAFFVQQKVFRQSGPGRCKRSRLF